jgi:hypothetical protein
MTHGANESLRFGRYDKRGLNEGAITGLLLVILLVVLFGGLLAQAVRTPASARSGNESASAEPLPAHRG